MNFETTNLILEKLKQYIDINDLEVSLESINYKNVKYKADFITIDKENNVGFEVIERSIIVFYFSEHTHFDNFITDENDTEYINHAIEFLENLFTLSIRHVETYKGKKLYYERYFFVKVNEDECFGGSWYGLVRLFNPFAKKSSKTTIWQYSVDLKKFQPLP
jgi:hypothetical protein